MNRLSLIVIALLGRGVRPRRAPRRISSSRSTFYNTYSFAHPPALRIKPGDRVVTKTIDAAGVDWNGKTVGERAQSADRPVLHRRRRAGRHARRHDREARDQSRDRRIRAACWRPIPSIRRRSPRASIASREAHHLDDRQGARRRAARSDRRAAGRHRAAAASRCSAASASRRRARKRSRPRRRAPSAATWTTRRWAPA